MIHFDVTKAAASSHRSGLTRVGTRLLAELGASARPVHWPEWPREAAAQDWIFTPELFSEAERPGMRAYLAQRPCRIAALFHDAIPLKLPHVTWPQSVARHPEYMKTLASVDRVWAVSHASKAELEGYWRWLGLDRVPRVDVLPLGADFNGTARVTTRAPKSPDLPVVLCVGIVEPRKNQAFLVEACEALWRGGHRFALHVVGRVNPHFGAPIVERFKAAAREHRASLHFHEAPDDSTLAHLYAAARVTAFPTIAEGCGLPLLESLWMGVPCVCSDLPVLRENADGGGCAVAVVNDRSAWVQTLGEVLTNDGVYSRLADEARTRALPTWAEAAAVLKST